MKRSPELIHKTMSAIRGKNTGIERKLRKALTEEGIRYRLYSPRVFGHPDLCLPAYRIAIFCDSEFWHGYHFEENVSSLAEYGDFWIAKIRRNIARDELVNKTLQEQGYTVLRFWGKQIEKDIKGVKKSILEMIEKRKEVERRRSLIEGRTTLVYVESEDKISYLLLHRTKKQHDPNEGKWIGVGGHIEEGESPFACMKREVYEETGLNVKKHRYLGYCDFLNDACPAERMYLYRVDSFEGNLKECDEGELRWVKKEEMLDLPMWEGDRAFLPYLETDGKPFRFTLLYHGDLLQSVEGPFFDAPKKTKKRKKKTKKKSRSI